jgi:eukaryotic-like serine/threonine-protein kinase
VNASDWSRLQQLFLEVVELDPVAREQYIADHGTDDPVVRDELRALLEADATPHLLDAWEPRPTPELLVGRSIGPYHVEAHIGRGGMGDVYRARRLDPFDLTVAIKRVRPGFGTDVILARFAAERQILAQLAHPHIARLLDGGADDTGCPYVVMEFVDGEPLDAYLRRGRLSLDRRLRLFTEICDAVHYAHQNLVVHRDLKPGNILLTHDGAPKLVDFGLAKVLGGLSGADVTQPLRLLTPAYAAPEQITGRQTGTAVDVYALGVILYEMLTGRRPYDLENRSAIEAERIVVGQEPVRPSRAAERPPAGDRESELRPPLSSAALARRLQGDLDSIVLKALNKDPERRYASAREFSADVTRHLQREPVLARPDSIAYRVNRFVRRHAAAVTAAVLVAVALVATTSLAVGRAREARGEALKAQRVSEFMQRVFLQGGGDYGRHSLTVGESLELASEAAGRELQDEIEPQVAVRRAIALTYAQLGQFDRASRLLTSILALSEARLGSTHSETVSTRAAQAVVSAETNDPGLAERRLTDAIALTERYPGADRDVPIYLRTVLTRFYIDRGQYDQADRQSRDALALLRSTSSANPLHLSTVLNNLGVTAYNRGHLQDAADWYGRALEASRRLANRSTYATTAQNLGVVHRMLGRLDAASALLQEAVDIRTELMGPDHSQTAIAQVHLGEVRLRQGRLDDARAVLSVALGTQRATLADGHVDLARSTSAMGALLCRTGEAASAAALFEEALRIRRTHLGVDHWLVASVEGQFGECLARQGRTSDARPLLVHSTEALERALGRDHPLTAESRVRLADIQR